MRINLNRGKILFVVCLAALYIAVLWRGTTETTRRTLELRDEVSTPNRVLVSVTVTNVNRTDQQLTAGIGFRLEGSIAQDEVTPDRDLQLLINSVGEQQQYVFPAGKRMGPIEARFPMKGDLNSYPWDRYETTMWLLATTPAGTRERSLSPMPENQHEGGAHPGGFAIGAGTFEGNVPVPLSVIVSAALPGIKFTGDVKRNASTQLAGITLNMRRSNNLIFVSILVNAMMCALAFSVLAMALFVTTASGKYDLIALPFSITLIFGLPALRNVEPGVPPVGVFADYVIFIWAELIVAVSAVISIWSWLIHRRSERER